MHVVSTLIYHGTVMYCICFQDKATEGQRNGYYQTRRNDGVWLVGDFDRSHSMECQFESCLQACVDCAHMDCNKCFQRRTEWNGCSTNQTYGGNPHRKLKWNSANAISCRFQTANISEDHLPNQAMKSQKGAFQDLSYHISHHVLQPLDGSPGWKNLEVGLLWTHLASAKVGGSKSGFYELVLQSK